MTRVRLRILRGTLYMLEHQTKELWDQVEPLGLFPPIVVESWRLAVAARYDTTQDEPAAVTRVTTMSAGQDAAQVEEGDQQQHQACAARADDVAAVAPAGEPGSPGRG